MNIFSTLDQFIINVASLYFTLCSKLYYKMFKLGKLTQIRIYSVYIRSIILLGLIN